MTEKPNLMHHILPILAACFLFSCSTTRREDKALYWKVPEEQDRRIFVISGTKNPQELERIVYTNSAVKSNALQRLSGASVGTLNQDDVALPITPTSTEDTIYLTNPSFFGYPSLSAVPKGWEDYGRLGESPPDIQPGAFNVLTAPKDGKTYLGLAYRDNGTNEAIGQKLPNPLLAGNQYSFSVWLASGSELSSISRLTGKPVKFDAPIALQILGFNKETGLGTVLAASKPVHHTAWAEYRFTLEPEITYAYFMLAALNPDGVPGNGYILVDGCSPIVRTK